MLKTRQWQDTQVDVMSDPQPWLAYYRTLRQLDGQLGAKTDIQDKFWEWLDDCLNCDIVALQLCFLRNMLQQLREVWRFQSVTDVLHGWQREWLHEPLHYQWMIQDRIVTMTDDKVHPLHLGHNQGSFTSASAAAELIQMLAQPPTHGAADNAATSPQTSLERLRQAFQPSAGQAPDAEEGVASPSQPGRATGWLNDHSASHDIDQQHRAHLQHDAPPAIEAQLVVQPNDQPPEQQAEQPDAQPFEQPHVAAGGENTQSTASSNGVGSPAAAPSSPAQTCGGACITLAQVQPS